MTTFLQKIQLVSNLLICNRVFVTDYNVDINPLSVNCSNNVGVNSQHVCLMVSHKSHFIAMSAISVAFVNSIAIEDLNFKQMCC